VTDISAIKKAEKLVKEQVKLDPLTGILNRTGFELELKHAVSEYEADATKFAIALVDIDHFKRVNDRMGHAASDSVLIAVAKRLSTLPGVRCAARVGGDEFAVLVDLPDGDKKEFAASVDRAVDRCFRPVNVGGKLIDLSGSVGVALFPENGSDVDVLTRAADMALLAAKDAGRARVQLVNAEIEAQHVRRGIISDSLADAILNRQIKPAFQPIVSAGRYDLKGMEVLARWIHPDIGVVTPDEFIPIAQASGLLSDLDQMIMVSACEQARDWLNSGLIGFISLNASPIELATRGYSTSLLAMLKRAGVSPGQISIEILESALIDGVPAILRNLERLNEAGVRIALDDFGTGFSNLQAATNLPLSGIKFDRSIIQRLNEEGMLRATTKSMATLFESFGLYTVAEGVETETHRKMAEDIGASHLQGFLFGKPLLFEDADRFVRSRALQSPSDGRKLA
jgi:diguanylate cyclase (GGDEF)-like protein